MFATISGPASYVVSKLREFIDQENAFISSFV